MLEAYLEHKNIEALAAQLPDDAVQVKHSLEAFLEDRPAHLLALMTLARCHLLDENMEQAQQTFETVLAHDPQNVFARVELARVLAAQGDVPGAIKLLREATEAAPEIVGHWQLLSEYLQRDNQQQASQEALSQYGMIKTFNDNLSAAQQAFAQGDYAKSDQICRQLLSRVPNEVRTFRLLARIARQLRYFEISTSLLARCVETRPADVSIGLDYIYSLLANNKHQQALEQCGRLIGLAPENIDIYEIKAEVLYNLGRFEEAMDIYRQLSAVDEKRALSLLYLGKLLKTVGDTEKAVECLHQALDEGLKPGQVFWELASLKTYRFSEDEIKSMQALVDDDKPHDINTILTRFALGKATEDAGQFAESFRHYQAANDAYGKIRSINYVSRNTELKSFFTPEYFADQKANGDVTEAPVFVVGIPRSGSTLVEQILTSHSMVDATMELTEIISIARELDSSGQPGTHQYPQSMARLTGKQIGELAQRYLDYAQPFRQQAPHFVDKTPGNFHHIGLIKTLFPNARIIDIRRHPMASGWSLYKHFFADSFMFSYDLETIGNYYNDYVELMDHWQQVLPGQILTVNYEDLVNDLPAAVDALLEYCGLAFEETCLNFHLNERAVATPSSEQVRQPLYGDAVEHWKNFEEFLTPLQAVVGKHDLTAGG